MEYRSVGTDGGAGSKLEQLSNIINTIADKIKTYDAKIDRIDRADIEPDVKERKLRKLNSESDKLKSDLKSAKSEVNKIKKTDRTPAKTGESKEAQLEAWHDNHTKLQAKLADLKPVLKDIMEGGHSVDVRAEKLNQYKADLKEIKKALKQSSAKLKKLS